MRFLHYHRVILFQNKTNHGPFRCAEPRPRASHQACARALVLPLWAFVALPTPALRPAALRLPNRRKRHAYGITSKRGQYSRRASVTTAKPFFALRAVFVPMEEKPISLCPYLIPFVFCHQSVVAIFSTPF